MAIKTIGVVGAGQMGNGIAQVAAYPGGLNVIMNDIADQFVNRGYDTISKNLDRLVAKDKIKADQKAEILGRIKKSTNLEDMKDADFVVEAATEREDLKLGIFKKLDEVCKPGVILASNTSSIPITRIAAATKRADWQSPTDDLSEADEVGLHAVKLRSSAAGHTEPGHDLIENEQRPVAFCNVAGRLKIVREWRHQSHVAGNGLDYESRDLAAMAFENGLQRLRIIVGHDKCFCHHSRRNADRLRHG